MRIVDPDSALFYKVRFASSRARIVREPRPTKLLLLSLKSVTSLRPPSWPSERLRKIRYKAADVYVSLPFMKGATLKIQPGASKYVKKVIVLILVVVLFPLRSQAESADFYLFFKECSSVIGYLHTLDFPLKTFKVGGITFACARKGKKFMCALSFEDGGKPEAGNPIEYELAAETGSILDITLPNGGDYIAIDRSAHTAVLVSRQASAKFMGAKTCRGMFLTSDEFTQLSKSTPDGKAK